MDDRLLPLGSVVMLQGGSTPIVVIGYYPDDGSRQYDYLGVTQVGGIGGGGQSVAFDASLVQEVVSRGYEDDEGRVAREALRNMMDYSAKAQGAIDAAKEDGSLDDALAGMSEEQIDEILKSNGLTRSELAEVLGIDEGRLHGKPDIAPLDLS